MLLTLSFAGYAVLRPSTSANGLLFLPDVIAKWLDSLPDFRTFLMTLVVLLPIAVILSRGRHRAGRKTVLCVGVLCLLGFECAQLLIPTREFAWADIGYTLLGGAFAEGIALLLARSKPEEVVDINVQIQGHPPVKFFLHGLNFSPEEIGIGKFSGEMVEYLAANGYDVTVITSPPYYPQWKIGQGYSAWKYSKEQTVVRSNDGSAGASPSRDEILREGEAPAEPDSTLPPTASYTILRCPIWVPRKVNGWKRVVHLASFGLSSIPTVLWQAIRKRPDIIMTVEPAAFCLPSTWLAAKLCGAKTWLHVQDFEVDAAFELGILTQPLLKKLVLKIEAFWMRRFDVVSSISPPMVERLLRKGVDAERTVLFPNWVDCSAIYPLEREGKLAAKANSNPADLEVCAEQVSLAAPIAVALSSGSASQFDGKVYLQAESQIEDGSAGASPSREASSPSREASSPSRDQTDNVASPSVEGAAPPISDSLRDLFKLPSNKCIALYAGNIGAKQGLEIIVDAAKLLHGDESLHFVICGAGAVFPKIKEAAAGLSNVSFLEPQPSELFNQLMNVADVHLLPQRADAADLVMPSKLAGMLASGRPVVACAAPGTQIADVVNGRGIVVPPGDVQQFSDSIRKLSCDQKLREQLGSNGRVFAELELGKVSILRRFAAAVKCLVAGPPLG